MEIRIEYCRVCNYGARAIAVADEILLHYEHVVAALVLVPADRSRFEISVDGKLVYSKLQSGRHIRPREIIDILRPYADEAERLARQGY